LSQIQVGATRAQISGWSATEIFPMAFSDFNLVNAHELGTIIQIVLLQTVLDGLAHILHKIIEGITLVEALPQLWCLSD
jgi:hypothetical protein